MIKHFLLSALLVCSLWADHAKLLEVNLQGIPVTAGMTKILRVQDDRILFDISKYISVKYAKLGDTPSVANFKTLNAKNAPKDTKYFQTVSKDYDTKYFFVNIIKD